MDVAIHEVLERYKVLVLINAVADGVAEFTEDYIVMAKVRNVGEEDILTEYAKFLVFHLAEGELLMPKLMNEEHIYSYLVGPIGELLKEVPYEGPRRTDSAI